MSLNITASTLMMAQQESTTIMSTTPLITTTTLMTPATNDCPTVFPSVDEYFGGFETTQIWLVAIGAVLVSLIIAICVLFSMKLAASVPKECTKSIIALQVIFPFIGLFAFVSMITPRAILLCDTVSFMAFALCANFLVSLAYKYVGGVSSFIASADQDVFTYRRPPFCLISYFKNSNVESHHITIAKLMVLQMPIAIFIITIIQNILYDEDKHYYLKSIPYLSPFIACSIVVCIWGLNINLRMLNTFVPEEKLLQKYFVLQLVLICFKLQAVIGDLVVAIGNFNCKPPITPTLYTHIVVQFLVITEMLILSIWSGRLYKLPSK